MRFTLDANGAQAAGQGIGGLFRAYFMGDQVRQQAEQEAMKSAADIYYRQMHGNALAAQARQHDAEAELKKQQLAFQQNPLENAMTELGLPTGLAPAFRQRLETGSFGPSYEPPADGMGPTQPAPADSDTVAKLGRTLALVQRMYGTGSHVDQMAHAGTELQTQGLRDRAAASVGDLDMMNRLSTLAKPGATYEPFRSMGDTGYAVNQATGQGVEASPVIAKLFQQVQGALVNQRNAGAAASGAAAGLSNARRDRVVSGLEKPVTVLDDNGAATNAKTRNAVIAAVERDFPGANDATIAAEVDKRLARRGMANKSPSAASVPPKIQLPQGYTADRALSEAKAAIAAGKDRNAVIQRLRDMGVEPKGL